MVGVPKSRGCLTCRQRKIKCDEIKPACFRCINSQFTCPGYLNSLKFQDEGVNLHRKFGNATHLAIHNNYRKGISDNLCHARRLNLEPCISRERISLSSVEELAVQLVGTFDSTIPAHRSLINFGAYMREVPCRIGLSKTCDLAVKSVILAHQSLLRSDSRIAAQSHIQYGRSLAELQRCLLDTDQVASDETLCAMILLSTYELLAASNRLASIQHAGGTSKLIQIRGVKCLKSPFACAMINAFRGQIIIEAVTCRKYCFLSSSPWKDMFNNRGKENQRPYNTLLYMLPEIPNILYLFRELRAKEVSCERESHYLLRKATSLWIELIEWRSNHSFVESFLTVKTPCPKSPFHYQITYTGNYVAALLCKHAAVMILLKCVILQLSGSKTLTTADNLVMAEHICQSYSFIADFAPFCNLYLDLALRAAWLIIQKQDQRDWIVQKVRELDPIKASGSVGDTITDLNSCFDYLML